MLTNTIPTSPLGTTQWWWKDGWSNANGITAEFEKRYSQGYGFQVFYQLINAARAAGEGWYVGTDVPTVYPTGQVPESRSERIKLLNYGRDIQIPKHELRFNWIVELPFGRGKALGTRSISRTASWAFPPATNRRPPRSIRTRRTTCPSARIRIPTTTCTEAATCSST